MTFDIAESRFRATLQGMGMFDADLEWDDRLPTGDNWSAAAGALRDGDWDDNTPTVSPWTNAEVDGTPYTFWDDNLPAT
jgi:hypothetical protein